MNRADANVEPNAPPRALHNRTPSAEALSRALASLDQSGPAADAAEGDFERRRFWTPVLLFLATCLSTFYVGAMAWQPFAASQAQILREVIGNWEQGATYMAAVLAILLTHEMGHFLQTVRYGIHASYPIFIPVPINPIGTFGAVIGMDGLRANRPQMFDIGIAGPLAGLVVALPVLYVGILRLEPAPAQGSLIFHNSLLAEWMITSLNPKFAAHSPDFSVGIEELNPYFMAGWVGLLITSLNMMPISQLDGGHVIYTLFGRRAHVIGRIFLVGAILAMAAFDTYRWALMLVLVVLIGADHPPTSNDRVALGPLRWLLGLASLVIPILCFPALGLSQQ
ncbi:MAG: site-2 protease family protein [Planctomycetales bacterium]|nr:site-2 protease family protein [Planctomycetales bacterium]